MTHPSYPIRYSLNSLMKRGAICLGSLSLLGSGIAGAQAESSLAGISSIPIGTQARSGMVFDSSQISFSEEPKPERILGGNGISTDNLVPTRQVKQQVVQAIPIVPIPIPVVIPPEEDSPITQPRRSVVRSINQPSNPVNTALTFPLSVPTPITSNFGWRVHPVTRQRRMHAGTDLGAPTGTPVVAAYPGRVEVARSLSGYGLTVYLRHEQNREESRYAHLSRILVREGQWVEAGTVIGLVGNTGLSSGPHLHFEWRHLTASGWTPVDAGLHLQAAKQNLTRALASQQQRQQAVY